MLKVRSLLARYIMPLSPGDANFISNKIIAADFIFVFNAYFISIETLRDDVSLGHLPIRYLDIVIKKFSEFSV